MEQKILEPSAEDLERINEQLAIAEEIVKANYPEVTLEYNQADLMWLQRILDDGILQATQTYELQSLGLAFGQIIANQTQFRWVTVEDEYGCDPALKYADTEIMLFPLTMISKRVEQGKKVDLVDMFEWVQEQIEMLSG